MATMISTPLRNACSCGPMPTPPKTAAPVSGVWIARSLMLARICAASSRVGVRTSARVVPINELVKDWKDERGGLAAAGHRACEDVTTFERGRDGIRLDGSGAGVAEFLEGFVETGVELEGTERHEVSGLE